LANQLRLSGYLLQAIEAFRRAVLIQPSDGWLWLEFGRCLHSLAGSEKDARLNRRSIAMMRLAERHAGSDAALLARLGESYFQAGELTRSSSVFQKAASTVGDNFRAARGLAEVAIREGKIAHVIHHFWAANRTGDTPSLRRWSRLEADYFARLNEDDEYMTMELSRVSLLEKIERGRRSCLRISLVGFPCILLGLLIEDFLIANIGWGVSITALTLWTTLTLCRQLMMSRIPFDVFDKDRAE
jgi:tetratricopeptide (TPR) repeat protein